MAYGTTHDLQLSAHWKGGNLMNYGPGGRSYKRVLSALHPMQSQNVTVIAHSHSDRRGFLLQPHDCKETWTIAEEQTKPSSAAAFQSVGLCPFELKHELICTLRFHGELAVQAVLHTLQAIGQPIEGCSPAGAYLTLSSALSEHFSNQSLVSACSS